MSTFTPKARLAVSDFEQVTWHDDVNGNWYIIDGLLDYLIRLQNFRGIWKNSTLYEAGDHALDATAGMLYKASVTHTSSPLPTTFAQERVLHPTYWQVAGYGVSFGGEWQPNTDYLANTFLVSGSRYLLTLTDHTSSTDLDADIAAGEILVLIDFSGNLPPVAGQALKYIRINPAGTDFEYRAPIDVLNDIQAEYRDAKGTLASAATVNIGAVTTRYIEITGGTSISSFGTAPAGTRRLLRFLAPITVQHNPALIDLPGGVNLVVTAPSMVEFVCTDGTVWRSISAEPLGAVAVSTVAQLRLTAPTTSGYVTLLGHTVVGDGGGGQFYWDELTTDPDDNGTLIRPTAVIVGAWRRMVTDYISVCWWGAQKDGSADAAAAIMAAVAYAKGAVVHVPRGSYLVLTQLLFEADPLAVFTPGPHLVGDGYDTVLDCRVTGGLFALKTDILAPFRGFWGGGFENLRMIGNGAGTPTPDQGGFELIGWLFGRFNEFTIERFAGLGFRTPKTTLTVEVPHCTFTTASVRVDTSEDINGKAVSSGPVSGPGIKAGTLVASAAPPNTFFLNAFPLSNQTDVTLTLGGNPDWAGVAFCEFHQFEVVRCGKGAFRDDSEGGFTKNKFFTPSFGLCGGPGYPQVYGSFGACEFSDGRIFNGPETGSPNPGRAIGVVLDGEISRARQAVFTRIESDGNSLHVWARNAHACTWDDVRFPNHNFKGTTGGMYGRRTFRFEPGWTVAECDVTNASDVVSQGFSVLNVTRTDGDNVVTTTDTFAGIQPGDLVDDVNFPPDTVVQFVDSNTQLRLTCNALSNGTATMVFRTNFEEECIVGDPVAINPRLVNLVRVALGSATIRAEGGLTFAGIVAGDQVAATSYLAAMTFDPGTVVDTVVSPTELLLNQPATFDRLLSVTFTTPGIPPGTRVAEVISPSQIRLDKDATATVPGALLSFCGGLRAVTNMYIDTPIYRVDPAGGTDKLPYPHEFFRGQGTFVSDIDLFEPTSSGHNEAFVLVSPGTSIARFRLVQAGIAISDRGEQPYASARVVRDVNVLRPSLYEIVNFDNTYVDRTQTYGTTAFVAFKSMYDIGLCAVVAGSTALTSLGIDLGACWSGTAGTNILTMAGLSVANCSTNTTANLTTTGDITGVQRGDAITGHADIPAGTRVGSLTTAVPYDTLVTPFTVGQKVTGGTSGATGWIVTNAASTLTLRDVQGVFADNEALSDPLGGSASANIPTGAVATIVMTKAATGTTTPISLTFTHRVTEKLIAPGATIVHPDIPVGTVVLPTPTGYPSGTSIALSQNLTGAIAAERVLVYNLTGYKKDQLLSHTSWLDSGFNTGANVSTLLAEDPTFDTAVLSAAAASTNPALEVTGGGYVCSPAPGLSLSGQGLFAVKCKATIADMIANSALLLLFTAGQSVLDQTDEIKPNSTASKSFQWSTEVALSRKVGIVPRIRQLSGVPVVNTVGSQFNRFTVRPVV